MGKPSKSNVLLPSDEYIVRVEGTRGTETSKYPEEEKINNDFLSSGERTGKRPNRLTTVGRGCGRQSVFMSDSRSALESASE